MPIAEVDICNLALIKLGAERISALDEDKKQAILLDTIYDLVRDATLRDGLWNFAIKRATLTPTAGVPEFGFDHEYDVPSDCLRIIRDEDEDTGEIEYVVENGKILSDEDELEIRYIYRNEDTSMYDLQFIDALSWNLAAKIAYALTQSSEVVKTCEAGYRSSLAVAKFTDSTEGKIGTLIADKWSNSRS